MLHHSISVHDARGLTWWMEGFSLRHGRRVYFTESGVRIGKRGVRIAEMTEMLWQAREWRSRRMNACKYNSIEWQLFLCHLSM